MSSAGDAGLYSRPSPGRSTVVHPELAIEAEGLVKHFGTTVAVDGVDLAVPQGTVYGLLGPNGAGKTTVVRMLATLLRPDGGRARVLGHDIEQDSDAVRTRVGLTGQFASVDEDLTGTENLTLLARLYGFSAARSRTRAKDLLAAFDLTDAGGKAVKTYSGGMRRRIDLAASLVMSPRVLYLDEPTTGLDPRSRNQVWDIVRLLVAEGATVLLTTQYLDEADQLADRIAVIDHGRLIAEGTAPQLKASVGTGTVTVRVAERAQRAAASVVLGDVLGMPVSELPDGLGLTARVPEHSPDAPARALSALHAAGLDVPEFSLGQHSLDEVFLALTGNPAEEPAAAEPTTAEATS